ncbi:MAG TPA: hypothetical protein VGO07_02470 [Candidatus Saccharimonadales bacterium]|jgi:hypothetical protein|nr:hypothetical protein [Candidatus Saccharimonadales bacterium]
MTHPIVSTPKGEHVYVDLVKSNAAANIALKPHLLTLVRQVLKQIQPEGDNVRMEQDMGHNVGYTSIVKTTDADTIIYAQLPYDPIYTRFVKNSKPPQTKYVSIILKRDDGGNYELQNAWIGKLNPPRPGTEGETAESRPYWAEHAFVYDGQQVQPRSVTKTCPY